MAEEQKPVEVAQETVPAVVEETPAAPALDAVAPAEPVVAAQDKVSEPEAAAAEEKKEDEPAKPIEEGHLSHKTAGQSFPKNLLGSKDFFFFGSEAFEAKALDAYKKSQKNAEAAINNVAWAAHTGKGLLFGGDKKAPSHVINLAHATEPETEGSNKFHLTAHGNKHTFKAANTAERDNWVAQLKAKINEAKELATSVTESETYKQTLESFKPAAKEEKAPEAAKEEAAAEETPAEAAATEEAKEEPKTEEPKRRSASRKRASFFGFGKKDVLPKEEAKTEEAAPATDAAATTEEAAATEAPAATEETPAEAVAAEEAAEDKPAESPKEKSSKRNSIFGNVFSKKEKKTAAAETPAAEEAKTEEAAATETAPVIPPVEENTPLADEINNASTEGTETVPEVKKDVKEKRKSSLPFAFGKREKSPAPAVEGEEKPAKESAFSKLRNTIKGKGAASPKVEEKATESATQVQEVAEEQTEAAQENAADAAAKVEDAIPSTTAEADKAENVATSTPAVTAAA